MKSMAGRILECRKLLFNKLKELGTPGTWNHIVDQKGMFGFTGLNGEWFSYMYCLRTPVYLRSDAPLLN